MKRIVNARIPLLLAALSAAGIAVGYLFFRYNLQLYLIAAALPVVAVIFILLLILTKKAKYSFIALAGALFFTAGALNCFMRLDAYSKSELKDGESYNVTATVCEKGENSYGEYLIIKNVKADGKTVRGKAYISLPKVYGDYCESGYKISFSAQASKYDVFPYGELNIKAEENIKHRFLITGTIKSERRFSLFGSISDSIHDALFKNLDKDTAAIAFAMLTGNTQSVDDAAMDSFRFGGIAHIFAVSGLHIGIVFGMLSFLLKKLKINKFISAPVCIVFILFYSGVCGFTLSSIRAVIMCSTAVISKLFNKKYDALNALSFAAALILFITPLSLFSVGFQLSVCAVLGICMLAKSFARPLKLLPQKASSAIGVSFGAQAGTMPIMLAHFGYLSGAGLLLNLIIVPVLSITFQIIFAAVLIAIIIPPSAQIIIPYAALPLEAVTSFLLDAGFEKALISGFGAGAFVALYALCALTASDKINLTRLKRCITFITAFTLTVAYVIIKTASPLSGYRIVSSAYYGGSQTLIKSKSGNVLIVTEKLNTARIKNLLSENYAFNVDAVVILGGENCMNAFGNLETDCDNVYVCGDYFHIQPYKNAVINYKNKFTVCGADFTFYGGYSLKVNINGTEIGICAGEVPFTRCGIIISASEAENCDSEYKVCYNGRNSQYNLYDTGDLKFNVNKDVIKLTK